LSLPSKPNSSCLGIFIILLITCYLQVYDGCQLRTYFSALPS
jgi:hypothetical protein